MRQFPLNFKKEERVLSRPLWSCSIHEADFKKLAIELLNVKEEKLLLKNDGLNFVKTNTEYFRKNSIST